MSLSDEDLRRLINAFNPEWKRVESIAYNARDIAEKQGFHLQRKIDELRADFDALVNAKVVVTRIRLNGRDYVLTPVDNFLQKESHVDEP